MAMTNHRSVGSVIGYFQAGGAAQNPAAYPLDLDRLGMDDHMASDRHLDLEIDYCITICGTNGSFFSLGVEVSRRKR